MMGNKERDTLEQYFADDVATVFLGKAKSDPDAARDALLIAAGYIRRGEALPGNLADHLAGAIEAAIRYEIELRNSLLAQLKDMALSGATQDELKHELKQKLANIEAQNPTGRL